MEKFERKGVTITWEIENVMYFLKQHPTLCSPVIIVDELDTTRWRFELNHNTTRSVISLILRRGLGVRRKWYEVEYQILVNTGSGKDVKVKREYSCKKGLHGPKVEWSDDQTFHSIVIQCQMWPRCNELKKNSNFVIQTPAKSGRCSFLGVVKNFSSLSTGVKKKLKRVSSSKGKKLMMINFMLCHLRSSFWKRNSLNIEVSSLSKQTGTFFGFEVMLLDSSGKKADFRKTEKVFISNSSNTCMLPVTKEYLMENAALYLPNDTLSLYCEVTSYKVKTHKIRRSSKCKEMVIDTFHPQTEV